MMKVFGIPVPHELHERAVYERQLLQSIRTSLQTNDLVIRHTADKQNTFYAVIMSQK